MRQSNVVAATVLAAALAVASTASAQAGPDAQTKSADAAARARGCRRNPTRGSSTSSWSDATAALRSKMRPTFTRPNSARRFICGTALLPADSAIDPKFEKARADKTTRFSMRVVSPSVCR